MKPLSDKTAGFTDSVIRRMTRVSNQYGAVNLSQGFPDFDPPKEITDRLREIAPHGPHQYALTWGAQNFREALARKHEHFSGMKVDPNKEIVVTCGSTEAMMAAMLTVCNPGDKVVVFSPFYENYGADAILSGAQPIYVPLNPPEFNFDANVLEDAMKQDGVKALILCNPSNPCGKGFTLEELQIIADLAMLYVGTILTKSSIKDVFSDWRTYACSFVRLVLIPLLVLMIARPLIHDPMIYGVLVIGHAMPVAGFCAIFAGEYGNDVVLASKFIFITTLLCIITIPIFVMLL